MRTPCGIPPCEPRHENPAMTTARGFTLLELLVVLFVSAVMFAIGYAGLAQVAANRAQILESQRSLGELQRAVRVLGNDLSQLDPRPIRDELGRSVSPALIAEPGTPSPLGFTRSGRAGTSEHARSSLQRIEYLLENGELVRLSWQVLDRAQGTQAARRVLMRGVRALKFRFLDRRGEWTEIWPQMQPTEGGDGGTLRSRPRAIEFTLESEAHGAIRRIVEVPG
ncbi:MAG: type II secretion system protein GspJ [Gammaproteobacteria bacterium]|nr:type II secretion system protein GspJ [Gammaproteobacteria bacterium]MBM4238881.1 type II secretion system protein GspJ [Gammaproteobacteria bacterium]